MTALNESTIHHLSSLRSRGDDTVMRKTLEVMLDDVPVATRDASGSVEELVVGGESLMYFIDVGGAASGATVEV